MKIILKTSDVAGGMSLVTLDGCWGRGRSRGNRGVLSAENFKNEEKIK